MKRIVSISIVFVMLCAIIPFEVIAKDTTNEDCRPLSSLSEKQILSFLDAVGVSIPEELNERMDIKKAIKSVEDNPDLYLGLGWTVLSDFAKDCAYAVSIYNQSIPVDNSITRYTLQYSTLYQWTPTTMQYYNCYAYVLGRNTACSPGDFSGQVYNHTASISALADLVKDDLQTGLNYKCVKIQTTRPSSVGSWTNVIAVRKDTTFDVFNYNDCHFAKLNSSNWYHKPGSTAVLKFINAPTNSIAWTDECYDGTYHEPTVTYDSDVRYILYKGSHTITSVWTGSHYHSGTKHYFKYLKKCSSCGASLGTYWVSQPCSGPPCPMPKSIK